MSVLRRTRALLESLPDGHGAEALATLERDLLPRTEGTAGALVVGIVGPNNAGKSALFNSLVGAPYSPSLPRGGATRSLLGAARGELIARLEEQPAEARFPFELVTPGENGTVAEALEESEDPARMFLAACPSLPPELLLIDTPDFDSILTDNRRASEALLQVADLALVVVTRHTYQNREVVAFLRRWLRHGRPWCLIYNESLGTDVTAQHARKLSDDLDTPPLAVFQAGFDLGIQTSASSLRARSLPSTALPADTPLLSWLSDPSQTREIKEKSLSVALARLADDLDGLAVRYERDGTKAEELLATAEEAAARAGRSVASRAMPAGPLLEAFRVVLDRRSSTLQRGFRGLLRRLRFGLERGLARLRSQPPTPRTGPGPGSPLAQAESQAMDQVWPLYFEELCQALRPQAAELETELARALTVDLDSVNTESARSTLQRAAAQDEGQLTSFQGACESLIEEELERRGSPWFFQLAVDALHVLPLVTAAVVVHATGGLGADAAVAGTGVLTSSLAERLSRLLGTEVARRARKRWTELRGARLSELLLAHALPRSTVLLRRSLHLRMETAAELREIVERLRHQPLGRD